MSCAKQTNSSENWFDSVKCDCAEMTACKKKHIPTSLKKLKNAEKLLAPEAYYLIRDVVQYHARWRYTGPPNQKEVNWKLILFSLFRPRISEVLGHPYFLKDEDKLNYLGSILGKFAGDDAEEKKAKFGKALARVSETLAPDWYRRLRSIGSGLYIQKVELMIAIQPDNILHLLQVIQCTGLASSSPELATLTRHAATQWRAAWPAKLADLVQSPGEFYTKVIHAKFPRLFMGTWIIGDTLSS